MSFFSKIFGDKANEISVDSVLTSQIKRPVSNPILKELQSANQIEPDKTPETNDYIIPKEKQDLIANQESAKYDSQQEKTEETPIIKKGRGRPSIVVTEEEIQEKQSIKQDYINSRANFFALRNKRKEKLNSIEEKIQQTIEQNIQQKKEQAEQNIPEQKQENKQQQKTLAQQVKEVLEIEIENNQELVDIYNQEVQPEKPLSNDVDLTEAIVDMAEIIETTKIENNIKLEVADFEIIEKERTDKTGYKKINVHVKSSKFDNINTIVNFNKLLSSINIKTNNQVEHRITDIRVINNANKTQLKNSSLKISSFTLTFKPLPKSLKVSKYKRILVSFLPDSIIIFCQDSRDKYIGQLFNKDFSNSSSQIEDFIGNLIYDFYYVSYSACVAKINALKNGKLSEKDAFLSVAKSITTSPNYYVKVNISEVNSFGDKIFVKSRKGDNQWLVTVIETKLSGKIEINCFSTFSASWAIDIKLAEQDQEISTLKNKILQILDKIYSQEFQIVKDDPEYDRILKLQNKITYRSLKKVFNYLADLIETNNNEHQIKILETLSKSESEKILSKDNLNRDTEAYKAEVIIGLSKEYEYFSIAWLGIAKVGGDKRSGKDYITSKEYYEKYGVSDNRKYEDRKKLKGDNDEDRNYNARDFEYLFEYKLRNGKSGILNLGTDLNRVKSLIINP